MYLLKNPGHLPLFIDHKKVAYNSVMNQVRIDESWKNELESEFAKEYWSSLTDFVREQYQTTKVYPPAGNIFKAFDLCPFDKVKVVIVGQDPYHGAGQANGLSFAVNDGVKLPPSLQNIFQEIQNDLGYTPTRSGDLSRWARQGVLMLNSVLTVAAHQPASHSKKGWETFTDAVIRTLNADRKHIVYMLWGKYAQAKGEGIDRENNLVLASAHPSPYSVTHFYGNHHFSQCNAYLEANNHTPIDWH
jgi:uracil-DNA glycosylase